MAIVKVISYHPMNRPGVDRLLLAIWPEKLVPDDRRLEQFLVDRRAKPETVIAELKKLSKLFPSGTNRIVVERDFFGGGWQSFMIEKSIYHSDVEATLLGRLREVQIQDFKAKTLLAILFWQRLAAPFRKLRDLVLRS